VNGPEAAAAAVTFLWLGMVLAISFLEAPLKFRAPGVTPQIGLGIGRLVFRALNTAEAVLAALIVVTMITGAPPAWFLAPAAAAVAVLGVQLAAVRPRLARRSDAVLSGADAPRSRSHHAYITLEIIKVLVLLAAGIAVLTFPR
jgi:hypothetical protein